MDSEEQIEPVETIRLLLGIFICLILLWVGISILFPGESKKTAAEINPIMFLINTFSFQTITLGAVGLFLKRRNIDASKVFGLKNSSFLQVMFLGIVGIIVFLPLGLQLQKIIIIIIKTYIGETAPVESQMVVQVLQREIPLSYKF
ncbi:MAG: hypothetical protein N2487_00965 [Verrucomicrobiae bacterium]|nr:hypothetical protein [Verrucomicrobiae bacterium]